MRRLLHRQSNRRTIRNPRQVLERARIARMLYQPQWTDLYCEDCLKQFAEQAENERPGHVWAVEDGKIIFMEDVIVERRLGRKLTKNETVVHKDSDPLNNRGENLEVVVIENL